MDESLTDFQEPKKSCAGPKKTVNNPKTNKPRKATKRPRGQKDIRTALKSTKKELESYSKEFDKVCKKSGIDVDSEELQLAIALSKSLQTTPSSSNDSSESSQTSTTQGRIGKIRTTLQEYGFKVPEIKIAGNTRKAPRKHRKNYKLLQTSDTEKKEIISEKYTQILFQDITHCSLYYSEVDTTNIPIYYLASNVPYDVLKHMNTFYINNLIEKSTSNGNLLRDWSTIPGRPESPKLFEPMSMNFCDIGCFQDELDVVLSGTINRCKDIVSKKMENWKDTNNCKIGSTSNKLDREDLYNLDKTLQATMKIANHQENDGRLAPRKKYRCYSPDIFDDDSDLFDESETETGALGVKTAEVSKNKNSNMVVMDLTQSLPDYSERELNIYSSKLSIIANGDKELQLSQNSEVTKRKSSELNHKDTQNPDATCETIPGKPETQQKHNSTTNLKRIEIELTERSVVDDETELTCTNKNAHTDNHLDNIDLTQSSNTSDELPFVSIPGTKKKSLDDTIIVDVNDYGHINKKTILQTDAEFHLDLTQCVQRENENSIHSQSFFEEYDHDHSVNTEDDKVSSDIVDEYNINKVNSSESPRKRMNKENYMDAKNNIEHGVLSLNVCRVELETVPVEEHPANNLRYPKPGKVDLTDESLATSTNCFVVADQKSNLQGAFTLQDHTDDEDLIENSKVCNESIHTNNYNICNESKETDSNSCSNHVDDIDLTQHSDESSDLNQMSRIRTPDLPDNDVVLSCTSREVSPNKSQELDKDVSIHDTSDNNDLLSLINSNSFCENNEMSLDYDELINVDTDNKCEPMIYENLDNSRSKLSRNNSMLSNFSQTSEVFDLTDKELDYSMHQSKLEIPRDNFDFGGISVMDELSNLATSKKSIDTGHYSKVNSEVENELEDFPEIPNLKGRKISRCKEISPIKHRRLTEIATPQKPSTSMVTVTTPRNSELIIKTNNVTPMIDYKSMPTPDLHKELDKYGIKPFKRKRAIQLLTHIYVQTHPIIENADELASPPKRYKPNNYIPSSPKKLLSPRKLITSPRKNDIDLDMTSNEVRQKENESESNNLSQKNGISKGKGKGKRSRNNQSQNHDDINIQNLPKNQGSLNREKLHNSQSKKVVIKEIECNPEDWVFQKREKAKVHSCRVPLHIAFYNYVSSRRELREAILCYEPVEIDMIHKDLVGYGHRYDPKDLLKFLDKKCITVKTTDNDGRNQKR